MVAVRLLGSMRSAIGGEEIVEVEAANTIQMLNALKKQYPVLEDIIEGGVSVAIDGLVYENAWFTEIKPDSEVVIMPLMKGG